VNAVARRRTSRWLELVYGCQPGDEDPAEAYHEASKVTPSQIGRQLEGARRLASSPELQLSSTRAVKRYGTERTPLPAPAALDQPLREVIRRRRSRRTFTDEPIAFTDLAALLDAGYGVTGAIDAEESRPSLPIRAVPSAGALYPLEVYVAVLRVADIEPGLYHFDPLRPGLEVVRAELTALDLTALSTYPEIVGGCAALLVLAAIFGRMRFKYGLRGYRFALLEAGHVGQNVVLAATALGLAAVPLGGFYDRMTDDFLGLDGVNESSVYTIALGREPA
jgi:SagB-type dehydrogenase family enzyme